MTKRVIRTGSLTRVNKGLVDYVAPGEIEHSLKTASGYKVDKIPCKIGYIEETDPDDGEEVLQARKVFIDHNGITAFGFHYYKATLEIDDGNIIAVDERGL